MESAIAGVFFVVAARFSVLLLQICPCTISAWRVLAPDIPYLGTACASFLIGFASPYVLNWILNGTGLMSRVDAQLKAIDRHGNHLLRLLHTASAQERLVSVTLNSRKVYIGTVAEAPNLEPHDTFVAITPWFSGFRDGRDLDLVLTVPYLEVYEQAGLDPEDFKVTVPISSIQTASFFDHTAYPHFLVAAGAPDDDSAASDEAVGEKRGELKDPN